jgi:hypothetical protein
MAERDVERLAARREGARRKREHGEKVRVARQGKTTTVSDRAQYDRLSRRIGEMERSGRIRMQATYEHSDEPWSDRLVGMVPCGTPQDVAQYEHLRMSRVAAAKKIGPDRLPSGITVHLRMNDREYVISAYVSWASALLSDSEARRQARGRPLTFRQRAIWCLWHYRKKAEITIAHLESKSAPFRRRCAECSHGYLPIHRPDGALARRGCPKCGSPRFQSLAPRSVQRPFGRITKLELQRRFKLSARALERILSAVATPTESVLPQAETAE